MCSAARLLKKDFLERFCWEGTKISVSIFCRSHYTISGIEALVVIRPRPRVKVVELQGLDQRL